MTGPGADPGSGERIGAYEIQGLLGRGGMGEVFLAWDARLRRRVAIKRIRHDHGLNPAMRQRLLREARAVAGLSHPAVVQVHDLLADASGDCIVLEYVEGRTLASTLTEDGRLEPATAVRLACEIAGGLAAAHAAGIVHRDLKAENVIVTPAGRAKILDFGLAQMSARAPDDPVVTQHGVLLGTFHTMSPEQAGGEGVDERSDLFSLGILLYEMLTGRSPFRGSSPTETLRKVLSEHPPRVDSVRSGLPTRLGDLVARLLAKEPTARPGSAAEVVRELAAVAASLASSDAPTQVASVSELPTVVEGPRPAVSRPVAPHPGAPGSTAGMSVLRRRGMRTAALAVLAVTALGAVAFWAARYFAGPRPAPTKATVAPVAAAAPLRVVMPRPEVEGDDPRLGLAASGALSAGLNTLASLEGVIPIDPLQLVGNPRSAIDMARVAAADEVLAVRLEAAGPLGRVTLRRIHGAEGRVMWTDTFDAPIEAADLRLLAEAVSIHLRQGYPGQPPRPDTPISEARNEDYT
ncbi:MAG TPA: serine/threonine-protein kinase, partial [Thermoanaerobaculia bacterium]